MMRFVSTASRASVDGAAIARSLHAPDAFATVFDRHFEFVHRYIARRVGSARADDLASQTFTLAFAHRGRYRDDLGTARPWLLGIATNLLLAERRLYRREQAVVERLGSEISVHGGVVAHDPASEDHDLAAALAALDPVQRDALLLHVWGELSYAEVAASLEVPIGTVRSRISRACANLRAALDPPTAIDGGIANANRDDLAAQGLAAIGRVAEKRSNHR